MKFSADSRFIFLHNISNRLNYIYQLHSKLQIVTCQILFESYKGKVYNYGAASVNMTLNINTNKFNLIGGDPSLDFVNTAGGRISNPQKKNGRDYFNAFYSDKLKSYGDLIAWSLEVGLIDEKEAKKFLRMSKDSSKAAEAVLKRAVNLRESLYRLFKSSIENWQPELEDLKILNLEFTEACKHQKLSFEKSGFVFEWIDRANALELMLWQISKSAVELLVNGDLSRLEHCRNDVCNWLFLDTSRNRSRQWCVMKDCGNLAKVRRFRAKQQAG